MLDDLATWHREHLPPEDLAELGHRLEAGDAETMSASGLAAMSLISERLIADNNNTGRKQGFAGYGEQGQPAD